MARILVIDDEELVRFTLRKYLVSAGHSVVEAKDGLEGLALQKSDPCDLVITDIIMPEKEGLETILALRQDDPDLPIIAISGGGRDGYTDYLEVARPFGANRSLAKPFTQDDLLGAVEDCLSKNS
ncbi:MAG: response regulator [Rhodospirillales bacterium]|jgi:CheY-like chemotaxis protein|nr:response regulator [Rhodospirillales bacterium]MDP6884224.1 response regulator [Rhodospirillales bacterium]